MFNKSFYILMFLFCLVSTSVYAASNDLEKKIEGVGAEGRFAVILFYDNEDTKEYKDMLKTVQKFVDKTSDKIDFIKLDAGDESAQSIVQKYRLSRAPKPLTLVFAPNGAITGGYAQKINTKKLEKSLVGPVQQEIVRATQARKPVILKIPGGSSQANEVVDKAIKEFEHLRKITPEVITITSLTKDDKELKKKFNIDFKQKTVQTIVLTTAGTMAGRFVGTVSAEEIYEALKNSGSSCCSK